MGVNLVVLRPFLSPFSYTPTVSSLTQGELLFSAMLFYCDASPSSLESDKKQTRIRISETEPKQILP